METVHVLVGVHRFQHRLVVNVVGEGELHDEPVHGRVVIQGTDRVQQRLLRDVGRMLHQGAFEANPGASFHFVTHIGPAGRVVTHQNGREVWAFESNCQPGVHRLGQFCFDGQRGGLAVQNLSHVWGVSI